MKKIIFINTKLSSNFTTITLRNICLAAGRNAQFNLLKSKAFINGEWVGAKSGKTFEVMNPATMEVVGSVPDMDVEDTRVAVGAAREAFGTWGATTGKERAEVLRRWFDVLQDEAKGQAALVTAESGKPAAEALGEVYYGNSYIEWFSEEARRVHGDVLQSHHKNREMLMVRQPIGVVGLITPWNFPQGMIARKAGAALAAGCTCVVRPAEETPLAALALALLAEQAGVPKGALNVVTSGRANAPAIGVELCTNPHVAGLSFTGSTEVGKILYKQCAQGVKRISLELGGDAPFIVFESTDLDNALDSAIASKFRNSGQTCVSANRFLIHESIFEPFVSKLKDRIVTLKVGDGSQPDVKLGPLINGRQIDKVDRIVQDAVDKGAAVLAGGKRSTVGPLFYEPTLLTGVTPDMACWREEVFGPVAACVPFKTEEEAVAVANDSARGLAGYLFTADLGQAWRVSRGLEVGMVGVNLGLISSPEAAFGGVKESGLGREGSRYGLDDYTYLKYICFGNLQPPTSNLQPPTSNLQPPTSNLQLPTSNLQP